MNILLLGGTGAMGSHLVNILGVDAANHISVTTRSNVQSKANINYLKGNAHDLEFLKEVLRQPWDVIVDFMVYSTDSFRERAELLLNGAHQYIFISSARVYSASMDMIDEQHPRLLDVSSDTSYLATDEYALSKARQEDLLRNSSSNNWTIVRPYITYSEARLQLGVLEKEDWLYRAINGRPIVFAKEMMDKRTTLTYGFDVARGISALIGENRALSQSYHITSDASLTWGEVLTLYLDVLEQHLGARPTVLLQDVNECYKWHAAKYQIMYDRLFNRRFDNTKIKSFISIEEFTDVTVGLQQCLAAFLQQPTFNDINWLAEAIKDKACGRHAALSQMPSIRLKLRYLKNRYI